MTERQFTASLSAPALARQFAVDAVDELLGGAPSPALCDDVKLIVSELVTNAVRAGSPNVTLRLDVSEDRLTIHVTDVADGWPHPRDALSDDPGGRGLALVSAVAASWGARLDTESKTVWAELPVQR